MAIITNSPLGLYEPNECIDANDNFAQYVVRDDAVKWQIAAACDTPIIGTEKLPCEDNHISDYRDSFNSPLAGITINQNNIVAVNAGTSTAYANYVRLNNSTLTPLKYYIVRYTINSYVKGFVKAYGTGSSISDERNANGTYTDIIQADSNGWIGFYFGDTTTTQTTLNITNVFIGCCRMDRIFDLPAGSYDFPSQTSLCYNGSEVIEANVIVLNDEYRNRVIDGGRYLVSFSVNTGSEVEFEFGVGDPFVFTKNTFFSRYLTFGGGIIRFQFDATAVSCISNFTIQYIPEIRAELHDSETGEVVENGLITEQIGSTLKVELSNDVSNGCYYISAADSCENNGGSFGGNILETTRTSPTNNINILNGDFTVVGDPSTGGYTFWNGVIVFLNALCKNKDYNGQFTLSFQLKTPRAVEDLYVKFNFGGAEYIYSKSGASDIDYPTEIPITITSGSDNFDLIVELSLALDLDLGETFDGSLNIFYPDDEELTYINMNAGQICGGYVSAPFKLVDEAPCDTVLLSYRANQNMLGFNYTDEGYREADGFINKLRIPARLWKQSIPVTQNIQRLSSGKRDKYFADLDFKRMLTVAPILDALHAPLAIALAHRTINIDGKEYVSNTEEYSPNWNKDSSLADVEIELFEQPVKRIVNSLN